MTARPSAPSPTCTATSCATSNAPACSPAASSCWASPSSVGSGSSDAQVLALALYALCAFAAAGLLFSLSRHLGGGVAAARAVTTTRGRDLSYAMTLLAAMRGLFRTLWVALLALAALVLIALAVQLTAA